MLKNIFAIICFLLIMQIKSYSQITITPSAVANTLVSKLVGGGVTYSNPTLTCASNGAGYFASTNAMLGLDSGIILTTGYVKNNGTNVGVNNSANVTAGEIRGFNVGDVDLFNLAHSINSSLISTNLKDVCKLEFDFVPQGDSIKFNYKFMSEEYPDYVCSQFNDYFAFFITGTPGFPTPTNLALVPGTNIPVAINSINSGVSGLNGNGIGTCNSMGAGSPFPSYFQNTSTSTSIVYNGSTVKLNCIAAVAPCSTYHMKFVVSDLIDGYLDSGVFLEAGSFKSEALTFDSIHSPTALPIHWPYATEGCNSDTIYIRRPFPRPYPQTVYVTIGGTATNGVDYPLIPSSVTIPANDTMTKIVVTPIQDNIAEGTETIIIGLKAASCNVAFSDTMTLLLNEYPSYTVTKSDTVCFGQSQTLSATLSLPDTNIKFKWNPGNFNSNPYIITPLSSGSYTVTSIYPGCATRDSIVQVTVAPKPTINAGLDVTFCTGDTILFTASGTTTFPYPIIYNWSPTATLLSNNSLSTLAVPTATTIYTITATNSAGCTSADELIANANLGYTLNTTITNVHCSNINGAINVSNSLNLSTLNYTLMPNNITNTTGIFNGLAGGITYTITSTGVGVCTKSIIVSLNTSPPINWASFTTNNINCNNANNAQIISSATGVGAVNYDLYPLNINNASGTFTNLSANTYTIIATDANSCSISSIVTFTNPIPMQYTSVTKTNVLCNGANNGIINALGTGGTGLLHYNLMPNNLLNTTGLFSSLSANIYTLVLIDMNNCSLDSVVSLIEPNQIAFSNYTTTALSCLPGNDAKIFSAVTGGIAPINFTINGTNTNTTGTFTNLSANIYTIVAADFNACKSTIVVTISNPVGPAISIVNTNPSGCVPNNTGDATIVVSASQPSYLYNIGSGYQASNVFTNLIANSYTAIVIDTLQCTDTMNFVINSLPNPTITSVNNAPSGCTNICDGIINIYASGGNGALQYTVNGTSQTSNTFNAMCANTYSVVVKDAYGCSASSTTIVTKIPSPVLNISTTKNISCFGNMDGKINTTTSNGTPTYQYFINGILNNAVDSFVNLTANTYSLIVIDANGCKDSATATITEPNAITFSSFTTHNPTCFNFTNGNINATAIGGNGTLQYALNNGAPKSTGVFTNLITNTIYTISVLDANNCSINSTVILTQPSALHFTSLITDSVHCWNATNGLIVSTAIGGTGTINYLLNPSMATNTTGTFLNLASNIYTVSIIDSNGCKVDSLAKINQPNPLNFSTLTASPINCFGDSNAIITATAIGGIGTYTFLLINKNSTNTTGIFNNLNAANYSIQVTDAVGCSRVSTLNITTPNVLIFNQVNHQNILCNGNNNGSIATQISGGNGGTIFSISPSVLSNNTTGNFSPLPVNNYTINATDSKGCKTKTTITISQPSALSIVIDSIVSPTCSSNNNGSIYCTATGGTNSFTYSSNPFTSSNTNGHFLNMLGIVYTLQATDANNCTISTIVSLLPPSPIIINSITTQNNLCFGDSLGVLKINATGGSGQFTYLINPSNITNSTGIFNNLKANNYIVTVTDANGCTKTSNAVINQNSKIYFSTMQIVNPFCGGGSEGKINVTVNGGTSPWLFSFNNSTFTSNNNFINLALGTYTIAVKDNNNCIIDTIITLQTPAPLLVNIDSSLDVMCPGKSDATIYSHAIYGNAGGYTFYLIPINLVNNTGTFSNVPSGTYTVVAKDILGCSGYNTITLQPSTDNVLIDFVVSPITCNGYAKDGALIANVTGGHLPYEYKWNFKNDTTNHIDSLSFGYYKLIVTDKFGCIAMDSFYMQPSPCCDVYIPNVFTPNGDGKNDIFIPLTSASIQVHQFDIFDRFGNRVFSTTQKDKGWDGKFNDLKMDMDTYFYIYNYKCLHDDKVYKKVGDFILMD